MAATTQRAIFVMQSKRQVEKLKVVEIKRFNLLRMLLAKIICFLRTTDKLANGKKLKATTDFKYR